MEHNESHKRDLKVQIREAFGRVVYTYTTHLKQAEFLVKKNKRIRIWQIFLSAISTGGFLGAIASDEVVMTWVAGIVSTILLALNLFFKEFDLAGDISSHRANSPRIMDYSRAIYFSSYRLLSSKRRYYHGATR